MTTRSRILLLITLLAGIGLFGYRDALYELGASVLHRENASHGVFIPFISAYIIWHRKERLSRIKPESWFRAGVVTVALGLLLFMVRPEGLETAVCSLSFLVVAAGLIVGLFGKHVMKELTFPIFLLAAMFPFPSGLYDLLTEWMRMVTTWGSVSLLKLVRFPIYREGYNVSIPGLDLFIAEGCSGIRYLIPYFVFGLAYAFITRTGLRARSLVVLATIPISILAGVMRQTSVFLAANYIGHFMADHRPHMFISWSVFVTVLVSALWMDQKLGGQNRSIRTRLTAALSPPLSNDESLVSSALDGSKTCIPD